MKIIVKAGESPGHPFRGNQYTTGQIAPKLPAELRSGTAGQVLERNRQRASIMRDAYGVEFSLVSSNPVGVAQAKRMGFPGAGLPRAIYSNKHDPVSDKETLDAVRGAYDNWKSATGYVTYTTLKYATGLPFQKLFGAIRYMQDQDPYSVAMTVDRTGANTAVKLEYAVTKGGPGSGNFGHAGRPGEVGGSQPGSGAGSSTVSLVRHLEARRSAMLDGGAMGDLRSAIRQSVENAGKGDGDDGILFEPGGATVEKQLPIDRPSQATLIAARTAIFQADVNALAESVYTGSITIGQWEESMRRLVREMHASISVIGKGSWKDMTPSDWGKMGSQLKKQYKYLHKFASDISANRETIALGSIQQRARMYGEAAKAALFIATTPIELLQQLPWMPKDGSTECLVNCKCVWVLTVTAVSRSTKTVVATWRMTPAEHCNDCSERSGYEITIRVPKAVDVPAYIGGM